MRSASSIVTFENSTWRMTGCLRSQSMIVGRSVLRPSTSIGTSGGHAVDEHEAPGPTRGGLTESRMTTSALFHAALVLVGRAHLDARPGIGAEHLLEEQVAGAHEQHGDLARRRQDGPRGVVGVEVVADVDARLHGAAAVVA